MTSRVMFSHAPRLRAVVRYVYGIATSGIGLVDRDYHTLHWTQIHDLVWRYANKSLRDYMFRRIVSVQWHHHDHKTSKARTWSKEEIMSGLANYEENTKSNLETYFVPALSKDLDILELGSGIGVAALVVAPRVRTYVGVDVSKASVRASEHLTSVLNNATFYCNNGLDLQMHSDQSFDLIHCGGTFMHMDLVHIYGYLKEFYRLLRPNGRICISFPNFENTRWFDNFVATASRQVNLPYSSLPSYRVRYITSRMVLKMLHEIGFGETHFFNKESAGSVADLSAADHCWATKRH